MKNFGLGRAPEGEAIEISLAVDGEPFRELVENPRNSKPNLAYDRC